MGSRANTICVWKRLRKVDNLNYSEVHVCLCSSICDSVHSSDRSSPLLQKPDRLAPLPSDFSLDAVVERLRKQRVGCCWVCPLHVSLCDDMLIHILLHPINFPSLFPVTVGLICKHIKIRCSLHCVWLQDEILCYTEELKKELEHLQKEYEKAAQQRVFIQQEQQDVAEVIVVNRSVCEFIFPSWSPNTASETHPGVQLWGAKVEWFRVEFGEFVVVSEIATFLLAPQ